MPRRNTPASPPMTGGRGDSVPGSAPGDMMFRVVLAVIISSTSVGMPFSAAKRDLVGTTSLNRAMRDSISACVGVQRFIGGLPLEHVMRAYFIRRRRERACEDIWTGAVRPSRRALRALLRVRKFS